MVDKFPQLMTLLMKLPENERPDVLIFDGKNAIFRCYRGHVSFEAAAGNYGIDDVDLDRGELLDILSKIEFLVNIIITSTIGSVNVGFLDDILDKIDMLTKIKLLNDWKIISTKEKEMLISIKNVRNELAHFWSADEVHYKNKLLHKKGEMKLFRKDLILAWNHLLSKYKSIQPNIDDVLRDVKNKL